MSYLPKVAAMPHGEFSCELLAGSAGSQAWLPAAGPADPHPASRGKLERNALPRAGMHVPSLEVFPANLDRASSKLALCKVSLLKMAMAGGVGTT